MITIFVCVCVFVNINVTDLSSMGLRVILKNSQILSLGNSLVEMY